MNEFDLKGYLYNNPLLEKKHDSKKGNKEEQKRMKGAIKDDEDHIEKLKKDIKADKKKLAKLKKDEPKDVNELSNPVMRKGLKGDDKEEKRTEKMREGEDKKLTKESLRSMIREKITSILNEEEITEEELEEGNIDYDAGPKGFLKKQPNNWLTEDDLEEQEEVDVDVEKDIDVDVKDEIDVDDESVESDIEVKSELPGEDADTAAVLGLLTKAQEEAEDMGDEVLLDQIGNTITYFTRKHVVKASS